MPGRRIALGADADGAAAVSFAWRMNSATLRPGKSAFTASTPGKLTTRETGMKLA